MAWNGVVQVVLSVNIFEPTHRRPINSEGEDGGRASVKLIPCQSVQNNRQTSHKTITVEWRARHFPTAQCLNNIMCIHLHMFVKSFKHSLKQNGNGIWKKSPTHVASQPQSTSFCNAFYLHFDGICVCHGITVNSVFILLRKEREQQQKTNDKLKLHLSIWLPHHCGEAKLCGERVRLFVGLNTRRKSAGRTEIFDDDTIKTIKEAPQGVQKPNKNRP